MSALVSLMVVVSALYKELARTNTINADVMLDRLGVLLEHPPFDDSPDVGMFRDIVGTMRAAVLDGVDERNRG